MKMSAHMAKKCNSLSHVVSIVYSCFLIMYCIMSYCVLCMYLICDLYTIVLTKVTRNKDIYMQVRWPLFCRRIRMLSLLREEGGSRCLEGNIKIVTSSVFVKLICLGFFYSRDNFYPVNIFQKIYV